MVAGKWHRFGAVRKRDLLCIWKVDFWRNVLNFIFVNIGFWQSLIYLYKLKPTVLFSKGGYVAVAPCLAAVVLKIPIILHDSDAISGVAHSLFEKHAKMRLSGFNLDLPDDDRYRHVGIPVNPIFGQPLTPEAKAKLLNKYNLPPKAQIVLATGGGGGALSLNQGVLDIVDQLDLKANTYLVVVTGGKHHTTASEQLAQLKQADRVRLLEFVDDMPDLVRASLGIITRAGATILSEISLAAKAAIIVPNPLLPKAHQLHNARIYQKAKAGWLVSDSGKQVNLRALKQAINELIHDSAKRAEKAKNSGKLALPDATQQALKVVEEVIADLRQPKSQAPRGQRQISQKDLLTSDARKHLKQKQSVRQGRRVLKISLLIALIGFGVFKLVYIGSIRLTLVENSPLAPATLTELQADVDNFLQEQTWSKRHFFAVESNLQQYLQDVAYIKDIHFKRDLFRSRLEVDIEPKHILGAFLAPNMSTIITDDGYVIAGYDNLVQNREFNLTVVSPRPIDKANELVLAPLHLSFLTEINAYLASQGHKLREVRISARPRELVLKLKDQDFDIIALMTEDPIKQGIAVSLALDFFARKQADSAVQLVQKDKKEGSISVPATYLDVRLVDRVIYK